MSNLTQNFPQIAAPFVNSDGTITAPWRQFLQALFLRTGGSISPGVGAFSVNEDDTSNHDYFPSWVTVNTGTATANVSSTKLKWNPSTGLFTAPHFSGSVQGNAATTTALQNPRVLSIGGTTGLYATGVVFDGTSNITFSLAGNLNLFNGGTSSDLSVTGGTSQVLKQTTLGAAITVGQLAASDLSNGTTGSGAVVLGSVSLTSGVTGTLPVANGGTGDTGTAWTQTTPAVSCGGTPGAFAATSVLRIKTIGKTAFFNLAITVTNVGTGTAPLTVTLPYASPSPVTAIFAVDSNNGGVYYGAVNSSGVASISVAPALHTFVISGVYETT